MLREQAKLISFSIMLVDLGITAASFNVAYHIRASAAFREFFTPLVGAPAIQSFSAYYWALLIIIPVWGLLLSMELSEIITVQLQFTANRETELYFTYTSL